MVFSDANDIRLKCFRERSSWEKDKWHPRIEELPANECDASDGSSNSVLSERNSEETTCNDGARDESTRHFMEPEEDLYEFKIV